MTLKTTLNMLADFAARKAEYTKKLGLYNAFSNFPVFGEDPVLR